MNALEAMFILLGLLITGLVCTVWWLVQTVNNLHATLRHHQEAIKGLHATCGHLHAMVSDAAQAVLRTMRHEQRAGTADIVTVRRQYRDLPPGGKIQ